MWNKEVRNHCLNHFQVQPSIYQRCGYSSCPVRGPWSSLLDGAVTSAGQIIVRKALNPSFDCSLFGAAKSWLGWGRTQGGKLLRVTFGPLGKPLNSSSSWASYLCQEIYMGSVGRDQRAFQERAGPRWGHIQAVNRLRGLWQMPHPEEALLFHPLSLLSLPLHQPPSLLSLPLSVSPSLSPPNPIPTQNPNVLPILKEHPLLLDSGLYLRGPQPPVDATSSPTLLPPIPLELKSAMAHFCCRKPEPRRTWEHENTNPPKERKVWWYEPNWATAPESERGRKVLALLALVQAPPKPVTVATRAKTPGLKQLSGGSLWPSPGAPAPAHFLWNMSTQLIRCQYEGGQGRGPQSSTREWPEDTGYPEGSCLSRTGWARLCCKVQERRKGWPRGCGTERWH